MSDDTNQDDNKQSDNKRSDGGWEVVTGGPTAGSGGGIRVLHIMQHDRDHTFKYELDRDHMPEHDDDDDRDDDAPTEKKS